MHDGVDAILTHLSQKLNSIFYDREFVGCVKEDLDIVLQNDKAVCLLFPKLKPFFLKALRYEALIFGLKVFYIGEGHNRIAVVCKQSLLVDETNGYCESKKTQKVNQDIKVMEEEEIAVKSLPKRSNRASRPTQSFYVPPARRVLNKKKTSGTVISNTETMNIGSKCNNTTDMVNDKEDCEICASGNLVLLDNDSLEIEVNSDTARTPQNIETTNSESITCKTCESDLLKTEKPESSLCTKSEELIPKFIVNDSIHLCFSQSEIPKTLTNSYNLHPNLKICDIFTELPESATIPSLDILKSNQLESTFLENCDSETCKEETVSKSNNDSQLKTDTNLYIAYTTESTNQNVIFKDDGDNETNKIQRTMENINRRSKPLIKHVYTDDTLRIEAIEKSRNGSSTNKKKLHTDLDSSRVEETNLSNWEDMFNEHGDLNKQYVGEIAKHIGCDVQILKATNDYSSYQNIIFQDLDHVIELYDFPSTFKTQDLIQLYSSAYQDSMYIKWCDDTHALLVLSTPAQAQRALKIEHDIIKSRPLVEASKVATLVASCTDLKPVMKRPQTNMQTARRLINTHLGTKIKISKETMEQERKVLVSARERKRLERQNEKDAWEGNPRNSH